MSERNVTVIGAGYWGQNLVRNFYQLGRLAVVCDSNWQVTNGVAEKYPGVRLTNDTGEALREAEAVVIATPVATHYEIVLAALNLGKDVFVEKPLALALAQGRELVSLAERRKVILMVGHLLEYHPAITKLKQLIKEGELGDIQYIYSNRLNLGKVRKEENILWSFAPHDISLILRLLKQMPIQVSCQGGSYLAKDVPDVTVSNLVFPGGVRAHIFVSWLNPFKEQKLVVMGSKQMAVFDDTISEKLTLFKPRLDLSGVGELIVERGDGQVVQIETAEPLRLECQHFLDCINNRRQPLTDGGSALAVLEVLEACQRSLKEGGGVTFLRPPRGYFSAPSAIIEAGAEIGQGTKIWHFSHVMKGAKVGRNCTIGKWVSIEPGVVVGDNVKIQNGVSVYSGVILEDGVFVGPYAVFTNVRRPRAGYPVGGKYDRTLVKRGATIGANATIVCPCTIGEYALVAAGTVVTKDVPDYTQVAGVPAKIVGRVDQKGQKEDG